MRARSEPELNAKRDSLRSLLQAGGERVRLAGGDLSDAAPFAAVDPGAVRTIIHGAAATRFNVAEDAARAVNIHGTEKLLAFARRCPRLDRLALLGTLYACGLQDGRIEEVRYDGTAGFANFYEWSKWEGERLLLGDFADLPWRLLRIATVIADDEAGTVTRQNAFHHTLRLLYYGLLPLLPGDAGTPLYFVAADFVAGAVFALTERTERTGIYHLAHGRADACTLGELVEIAFTAFERDAAFRARRVLRPLYCDWESFAALAGAVDDFGGPVVKQALCSIAPFARQLFSVKDVDNRNLLARCVACRPPDARALIAATCVDLLRNRWGKRAAGDGSAAMEAETLCNGGSPC